MEDSRQSESTTPIVKSSDNYAYHAYSPNVDSDPDLAPNSNQTVFEHFFCRLAAHRNRAIRYATTELAGSSVSLLSSNVKGRDAYKDVVNGWAQELLGNAWVVCRTDSKDPCPTLHEFADTSTNHLPPLPSPEILKQILNTILFLHITSSKSYSAHTRAFLVAFGFESLDENLIVEALKNPESSVKKEEDKDEEQKKEKDEAQKQTEEATTSHALKGRTMRMVGMGLGAIAGGVLIGVTGGLAAPLVGAGVSTVLGVIGVGGTSVGLIASGLASSSVVCGTLFGVYGAKSMAGMIERHTREVRDLAIVRVGEERENETLAARLCVSGWLESDADVTEPWRVVADGDDTFALQWEKEALKELSNALMMLLTSSAMKYIRVEVLRRTVFSTLMMSLAPLALLKFGQIIDNPWMNCRARAIKAGAVLGELLSKRVLGHRPVSLSGYSLGSLVIFEAIKYLSQLPPKETAHLIENVYLFGSPIPVDDAAWTRIRRVVAGRVVNGYCSADYVLGVLCRVTSGGWKVAGLEKVEVEGVENILCEQIDGHTRWRVEVGACLQQMT
ncbi:DUF726-domain-containing protein [Pluteus cervinus]|uniref:DUF726-domain-containing protein n=1 Tax=Pluteus cervinus TaxID=181527 RepID=A0ACD3BEZ2_9AGAR|nr:DUF726-domain-containing protein [Pluteus cervinus]